MANLTRYYKKREETIQLFNDYSKMLSEARYGAMKEEGVKGVSEK